MPKKSLCLLALLMLCPLPSWAMEFVDVPAGCFMMGCNANVEDCHGNGLPRHRVCVDAFQMGKYEVTQAEWVAVMDHNDSHFEGRNRPVENVSWYDAQEFIKRLNEQGEVHYRLPTEAEWEYAARAGTGTTYPCGNEASCLDRIAWYGDTTQPVGQKQPNDWGLYDMQGNVDEWVQDCYSSYEDAPNDGAAVEWSTCNDRVLRGGSWGNKPWNLRSAFRFWGDPSRRYYFAGFRLVRMF